MKDKNVTQGQRGFAALRPLAFYVLFLLVVWGLENWVGEKTWFTSLLLYVPQQIFALPFFVFAFIFMRRKSVIGFLCLSVVVVLFIVTFLGLRWNKSTHIGSKKISIVTCNIEQLQNGPESLRLMVQQNDIDILCLQEAHASHDIADPLPRIRKVLSGWKVARYGELVTLTRHHILRQTIHRLPTRVGSGILETVIETRGKRLTIFNVHFNLPVDGIEGLIPSVMKSTAVVRRQQKDLLQQLTNNCRTDFVVAGDFNTPPRGPFYQQLSTQ